MNFGGREGAAFIEKYLNLAPSPAGVQVGFAPSFLAIGVVKSSLGQNKKIWVGGQDCLWPERGAFTGSISVPMLVDAEVDFCIVGHSERRGRFGKLEIPPSTIGLFAESDETVNLKARALLDQNRFAVVCVGETLEEREAGHTDSVLVKQLEGALGGFSGSDASRIILAYEPVWAIGTGRVCESEEANRICGLIRASAESILSTNPSTRVPVLYGGSVKASNAQELFRQPAIDGGLVGGASLDPVEFAAIVAAAGAV